MSPNSTNFLNSNMNDSKKQKKTPTKNFIWNYQILLKSGYFESEEENMETKKDSQKEKWVRLIGDQAVAARAEKAVSRGEVDRFRMMIQFNENKNKVKDDFSPERDRFLSIREIFREYIGVIVDYIKDKYPNGMFFKRIN